MERQLSQIEGDISIKPAQKLIYRGQLISILTSLVPKQIEQKIEGEVQGDLNFILRAWRPEYDKDKDEEDGRDHN
ncbi:unnamed protein product [marine sediment metagenome]|uniref:Uncharacterized protein n=1 Tax=marine sediment metagenome TaxID=412755 RepID=X1DQV1_9ZZZZ